MFCQSFESDCLSLKTKLILYWIFGEQLPFIPNLNIDKHSYLFVQFCILNSEFSPPRQIIMRNNESIK